MVMPLGRLGRVQDQLASFQSTGTAQERPASFQATVNPLEQLRTDMFGFRFKSHRILKEFFSSTDIEEPKNVSQADSIIY